ncbi:MAG: sensor histidine kinase, partial [Actinobacteria bacterium]|nr:sensor histidine kinase [Actinomycetota bacterium]
ASPRAERLVQAVSNLVENALRHAPAGSSVIVDIRDVEVSVIDQGPGLSSEDVEHAFERFYLYRRYGSDRPVGTGLGLAVVKEVVEAMGGRTSIASAPGKGACFTLHLREAAGSQDLVPGAVRASGK